MVSDLVYQEADLGTKSCCSPPTDRVSDAPKVGDIPATQSQLEIRVASIPGGPALMGTDVPMIPADEEGPARQKPIKPFLMMETAVTNAMFAQFVEETGFVTEAERFGWSFVFYSDVSTDTPPTQGVAGVEWWRRVDGSDWRHVNGPGSQSEWLPDHPVVHVSWNDAKAYAKWAGGRLPKEAEWEHAARGGLGDVPFPWGGKEPDDFDFQPCNIWQGSFPNQNAVTDGYKTTAPAKSFEPNGYGLYNMAGNVWEWTSEPYKVRSNSKAAREFAKQKKGMKIMKGGSFLCHKSYCFRYRIPARTGTTPDPTTSHQGFRLVFDAPKTLQDGAGV